MTGGSEDANKADPSVTDPSVTGAPGAQKERTRRQRSRSIAIAAILGGLVVLFYIITVLKMSGNGGAAAI